AGSTAPACRRGGRAGSRSSARRPAGARRAAGVSGTGVSVLGSTGSIGVQALEVVRAAGSRFRVVALAARRSAERLAAQAREFRPPVVAIAEEAGAAALARELPAGCRLEAGPEAVAELAA